MILMMILCGVLFALGIASLIALWFEEYAGHHRRRVTDYELQRRALQAKREHNHRYHRCRPDSAECD